MDCPKFYGLRQLTEAVTLEALHAAEGVEGADPLGADCPDLGAEGDFVDGVREVIRVRLLVRRVRRHVEVARNLQIKTFEQFVIEQNCQSTCNIQFICCSS